MSAVDPKALAAVEAAEARFLAAQELERLRLFRLHLQATVTEVSPLTADLIRHQGSDLASLADQLRPVVERIPGMLHLPALRRYLVAETKGRRLAKDPVRVRQSDLRMSRRIAREGVILPSREGSRDRLGVVPIDGVLECAGWIGDSWFCTEREIAHLLVDLPDTIAAAPSGRVVGDLIGHPALAGRPYRVRRVVFLGEGPGVVVTFHTGLMKHHMPWADQLAEEMRRGS